MPPNQGESGGELERLRLENETLSGVVGVVASGPDLVHILDRVVDLLTRATESHACFVYLASDARLVLRAASPVYSHLVGRISFGIDEGLAGWVMGEGRPAFIREGASDDPRTTYVAELEEERFQSMGAVPISSRSGDAIGAIVLHTVAPREFDEGIINVLSRTASLVSGAIENARLYEEARERVEELTRLSTLGQEIAAVSERPALLEAAAAGIAALIGADACRIYEAEPDGEVRRVAASPPLEPAPLDEELEPAEARAMPALLAGEAPLAEAGAALGLADCASALAVPLASGEGRTGAIVVAGSATWPSSGVELIRAAAHQLSLALEKIELIERLTGENAARDLLDALAASEHDAASGLAAAAGIDLSRPHVVAVARAAPGASQEAWNRSGPAAEALLQRLNRGSVCDLSASAVRALLPVRAEGVEAARQLAEALDELAGAEQLVIGLSDARRSPAGAERGLREAADAARIGAALVGGGAVVLYQDTGAYRYLIDLLEEGGPEDDLREKVDRLGRYDGERRSQLLVTLDVYLTEGRSIAAAARELWVHVNTVRQRLERIETITETKLADEDPLALHLAVKLARARAGAAATFPLLPPPATRPRD